MNRAELVNSLTKKGFRPDGQGGFTKEPLSKSHVISHETSPVATELRNPKPKQDVGPALDAASQNETSSPGRVIVCITRHSTGTVDFSNGAGGCKAIEDQLKYNNLIYDDNPEEIDFQFRQKKVKRKDQGTLIEITYP